MDKTVKKFVFFPCIFRDILGTLTHAQISLTQSEVAEYYSGTL